MCNQHRRQIRQPVILAADTVLTKQATYTQNKLLSPAKLQNRFCGKPNIPVVISICISGT